MTRRTPRAAAPAGAGGASAGDVDAIVSGTHGDPFAVLGVHPGDKGFVARCFIPHAGSVEAFTLDGSPCGALRPKGEAGFFEGEVSLKNR
ncbi:MAG: 1,4-alpha-glucan branching enzyme, partial [Mesorhizobium sp.]|nr:1,4-alpha-glucan branching enzyme [Mesorhizobium sp.]